jgi:hypothetical protein
VGIKEVDDGIWLVTFMSYDLGYIDLETRVLEPLENPFGPKVLPMCPGWTPPEMVEPMGFEPTNLLLSPDDSIDLRSLISKKMAH